MSSTTATATATRPHAVPVPRPVAAHRRAVARWALSRGRPAHRDALAALLGTRAEELDAPEDLLSASILTVDEIGSLLWISVAEWCVEHGAELPEPHQVASTLDTYLRFLSANRLLARGSDPVAALRRAIGDYGGGHSRAHPAVAARAAAPVVPIA